MSLILGSQLGAFGAVMAWIVLWEMLFPGAWTGHDDHALTVFWIGFFAYPAIKVMSWLATFLRGRM